MGKSLFIARELHNSMDEVIDKLHKLLIAQLS